MSYGRTNNQTNKQTNRDYNFIYKDEPAVVEKSCFLVFTFINQGYIGTQTICTLETKINNTSRDTFSLFIKLKTN